jgi:hypothetical protein
MVFRTPLSAHERLDRMRRNSMSFRGARLAPCSDDRGTVTICGFGPSLADTWLDIRGPVMTTSGSHDFLLERGIVPTYHVETDPRRRKTRFLERSHPSVTYLLNSQCHPRAFELLRARRVVLWHGFTDDDADRQIELVESLEPGTRLMAGGTNVGMRALSVARELGFTGFECHGFDCCYFGAKQWAGEHYTAAHRTVQVEVEGALFETSDLMMQSTDDFFNAMRMMPGCRFRVHGDGLLDARLKLFNRDFAKALGPEWFRPVNFVIRRAA